MARLLHETYDLLGVCFLNYFSMKLNPVEVCVLIFGQNSAQDFFSYFCGGKMGGKKEHLPRL